MIIHLSVFILKKEARVHPKRSTLDRDQLQMADIVDVHGAMLRAYSESGLFGLKLRKGGKEEREKGREIKKERGKHHRGSPFSDSSFAEGR